MPKVKTHRGLAKRVKVTATRKNKEVAGLPQPPAFIEVTEKKEEPFPDGYGTLGQRKRT